MRRREEGRGKGWRGERERRGEGERMENTPQDASESGMRDDTNAHVSGIEG